VRDEAKNNDDLVMGLVELALSQPEDERDAYVHSACAGDTKLLGQVLSYVDWDRRMKGFLLEPLYPPVIDDHPFETGDLLAGRFRVTREVAQGGMGIVYEALDEKLDRRIAIKCAKAGFRKRLPPEVRNAREISHPNVCKIFEIHTASTAYGQIDFIAMEFLDGETLTERLWRGPLAEPEARVIAEQLCAGLSEAHRHRVIHGDLKSNNIILTTGPGGATRAVITDFGLARRPDSSNPAKQSGITGGTPAYMAPELWRGEKGSVASDIYAFGVILYEMASGRRPDETVPGALASAETISLKPNQGWQERLTRRAPPLNHKWDRILDRCLDPDPAQRFQNAEEIARRLAPRSLRGISAAAAAVVLSIVSAVVTYDRSVAPPSPLRLVLLPFSVDGDPIQSASGMANDIANRLSGLRRNFAVISPVEAARNQVHSMPEAKSALSATHVLETRLSHMGPVIAASAELYDTGSGRVVRELKGSYPANDVQVLAKALTATIAGGLGLRPVALEVVSAAAYPYYIQAMALLQRDQVSADQAIPLFRKAIELDPRSALPLAGLAEAQIQKAIEGFGSDWLDQARSALAHAKSLNPDSATVLLASGLWNLRRGSYEQAIQDLNRAAQLEPNNAAARNRIGTTYDRMNRPDDAIAAYQKAIEIQPGYYRHYLELGLYYYYNGRYREAEDLMRRVTALAPQLTAGHLNLAAILSDQGRYSECETELLTSLRIEETPLALNNLGFLYRYMGRDSDALKYFEKSQAAGPPTVVLYLNLGDTYRRLGRDRESRDAYQRGRALAQQEVAVNPRTPLSRSYLALFWARLGDPGQARYEIAQALSISPENTRTMRLAAITYELLQQRDKTLEVLRNAPPDLLNELNREPDLRELQQDSRFVELLRKQPQ
jgi:serine/threonine protein kinase/tetratricopeptide (TPR) repeat protein